MNYGISLFFYHLFLALILSGSEKLFAQGMKSSNAKLREWKLGESGSKEGRTAGWGNGGRRQQSVSTSISGHRSRSPSRREDYYHYLPTSFTSENEPHDVPALALPNSTIAPKERRGKGSRGRGSASSPWVLCRSFPGLTREQLALCRRAPEATSAAIQGLQLAVSECQYQFRKHRWNCSSLSTKNKNPASSPILQRGFRESAFAHAASAAGVTSAVSRACSNGRLLSCSCDPVGRSHRHGDGEKPDISSGRRGARSHEKSLYESNHGRTSGEDYANLDASTSHHPRRHWEWGGCGHNLEYGLTFSRLLLDARERRGGDIRSKTNLHNNRAGRLAISNNSQVRCKCHGMSGSCEMKTCWRAAPDFRRVGDALTRRYRNAVLVTDANLGRGSPLLVAATTEPTPRDDEDDEGGSDKGDDDDEEDDEEDEEERLRRAQPHPEDLLYFERSPNFCEASSVSPGTSGRKCVAGRRRPKRRDGTGGRRMDGGEEDADGPDSCSSLCCGRGYNVVRQKRTERCGCRFQWCCNVVCSNCTREEWVTVCK